MKNTIPRSLVNDFQHGRVCIFVGAGLSMSAGLPSWTELLDDLENRLVSGAEDDNMFLSSCGALERAQFFYDAAGKANVINSIRDIFKRRQSKSDTFEHMMLSSLPTNNIITTNWDDLIERAFSKTGVDLRVIWKDSQISPEAVDTTQLIKLHGDLNDPASIIFSDDDYAEFFNKNSLMESYLATILARSTILMVGYSFQDITFKSICKYVSERLGGNSGKMYMLALQSSQSQVNYLEKRGLHCITFSGKNYTEASADFFGKLAAEVAVEASNPTDRLKIVQRENSKILASAKPLILRNMAALGPMATPMVNTSEKIFGENTELELINGQTWLGCLRIQGAKAKLILCLDTLMAKDVFERDAYLLRLDALLHNLKALAGKVEIVDSGSPLIMSNYDIYGDQVALENLKTDINTMGYGHLRVHRSRRAVEHSIRLFDEIFESVRRLNLREAKFVSEDREEEDKHLYDLVVSRVQSLREDVAENW